MNSLLKTKSKICFYRMVNEVKNYLMIPAVSDVGEDHICMETNEGGRVCSCTGLTQFSIYMLFSKLDRHHHYYVCSIKHYFD